MQEKFDIKFYNNVRKIISRPFKLYFNPNINGLENIPDKPYILAGNHTSLMDIPFLIVALKDDIHFMAKKELFSNKINSLSFIIFLYILIYFCSLSPKQANLKSLASILIIIIISLILRYVNGYTTFVEGFGYGFLLWTIVNIYDAVVMDIIWFCHDPYFVFKGTEDMVNEYHNYWFHIKGSLIGELLALVICAIVGLVIQFIL